MQIPKHYVVFLRASQMVLMVKNLPVNEGKVRDMGLIARSGRSLGQKDPMKEGMATQVFLPGKSHGQRSLVGYSP